MKTYIIRPIQQKDNPQIARVIRDVLIEFGVPKVGTAFADKSLDSMFENYNSERRIYFVVEENGSIIGGAGVSPLDNFEGNVCELQKMYFSPQARARGIGSEIMEICLNKARALGFEQCYLETMPYMEDARKLYYKNGFENLDNPLGDTGHYSCNVWMIKNL